MPASSPIGLTFNHIMDRRHIYRLRKRRPARRLLHERAHAGSGRVPSSSRSSFSFCSTSTLPYSGQMLSWQNGNSFLQTRQNIQYDETGCELKSVLRIRRCDRDPSECLPYSDVLDLSMFLFSVDLRMVRLGALARNQIGHWAVLMDAVFDSVNAIASESHYAVQRSQCSLIGLILLSAFPSDPWGRQRMSDIIRS